MLKALSLFALLNPLEAAEFVDYSNGSFSLQYKVEGTIAEYNLFLTQVLTRTGCQTFFGTGSTLPNPYTVTSSGLNLTCTNLTGDTFGANVKVNSGLPETELTAIANGLKVYYPKTVGVSSDISTAYPNTCLVDCPLKYAKTNVRVLSFNTYLLGGTEIATLTIDNAHSDFRTDAIAKKLKDFDIVGLQEIYNPRDNGRKIRLIQKAAEVGLKYYALPMATITTSSPAFTNDGGQLILSRYPIAAKDFSLFPKHSLSASARGVLYAKVQTKATQHLHYFSTHLQASLSTYTEAQYITSMETR